MSLCEWNPVAGRPAMYSGDTHRVDAVVSVGAGKNNWHLCESCAALPRFKRLRRRVRLSDAARAKRDKGEGK